MVFLSTEQVGTFLEFFLRSEFPRIEWGGRHVKSVQGQGWGGGGGGSYKSNVARTHIKNIP